MTEDARGTPGGTRGTRTKVRRTTRAARAATGEARGTEPDAPDTRSDKRGTTERGAVPTPLPLPPEVAEMLRAGALFALSHSGGKDSQAMTILLRRVVPPEQLVVVHAPLGRVEWPGTLAHVRATTRGLPLVLARAKADLLAMVRRRGRFPTPAIRQCTSDLKRGPIEREVRRYLRAHPRFGGRVVSCMGLRADESASRARRPALAFSARNSKAGRRWLDWLPIHGMSGTQVFATIAAAGERPHWVYSRGLSRCSCSFCIMASRRDLVLAARLRPRLAAEYVALEEEIGHTLSPSCRPLREIVGGPTEARDGSASGPGAVDARPPPPYKRGTGG